MDAYAQHLASVNEVQDVIAAEDIFNAQGQVIVKKGTPIDRKMAERVAKFKLLKPIEHSVDIDQELQADELMECFAAFIGGDPSLKNTFDNSPLLPRLRANCEHLCSNALLRQKVTVISLLMPTIFEQAMFCAWFALMLDDRMGDAIEDEKDMFVAAMCHDIGMVHISSEILEKKEDLSEEEWRQIQAHPVISFNIVKELLGNKGKAAQAVLEHHENLDGTGYPRGLSATKLCEEGRLLNLLDSVNAVYSKHFRPVGRPLADLTPIIQMNLHSRFGKAGNLLIVLLKSTPASSEHSIPTGMANHVIQAVKQKNEYISQCMTVTREIADKLGFDRDETKLNAIQNAIIHLTLAIAQSGIINEAYVRWLDQVKQEQLEHAYKEVEEAYLLMKEIAYHIDKLKLLMKLFISNHPKHKACGFLHNQIKRIDKITKPSLDDPLSQLWIFRH